MHLEIAKLHKQFDTPQGPLVALKDINLHVETGEFVCAVGASGSGKSTLLRLVAGLEMPTAGEITVDGQPVMGPGADRGMVFQSYTLYPWMTVQENVEFGLKLQGLEAKQRREEASRYLDVVGLAQFSRSLPKELSGGMKQRVAIARALANHPKILLLDEPTEGIQPSIIKDIARTLNEISRTRDITIIVSEQILSFTLEIADRLLVMEAGHVVHETARADCDEATISRYLSV